MKTTLSKVGIFCLAISFLLIGCGEKPAPTPKGNGGSDTGGLLNVGEKENESGEYVILDTLTDQFDRAKAKANAEDTISKHNDIDAMVGLFAYNPPLILEALKQADKVGKVKVIAFDEDEATLQGIKDGTVHGTVVQNPYMYGYKSIEVLAALKAGKKDVIPENKFIDIPAQQIRKDNVDEFWADLKNKTSGGKKPAKQEDKPSFAFVSNGVASFWTIAGVGVYKAGADLGVNTEVLMPAGLSAPAGSAASSTYSASPVVCITPARCGCDSPTTLTPPAFAASLSAEPSTGAWISPRGAASRPG